MSQPARLSDHALTTLRDGGNDVYLSAASVWEIAIKVALGKLVLPDRLAVFVPGRLALQGLTSLPVTVEHAARVEALPPLHRDPFDRMLVAQALVEGLSIMTADPAIALYDVDLAWASRVPPPR